MAREVTRNRKIAFTLLAWMVGLTLFFPVLWTILTSFKTEGEAIATPPSFLFFEWTLENYVEVQSRSNYFRHAMNSVIISLGSTLLGLLIAIPAAWAMAFSPTKRTKDVLMWMLSTKMLPAVGVLMPIYIICQRLGLSVHTARDHVQSVLEKMDAHSRIEAVVRAVDPGAEERPDRLWLYTTRAARPPPARTRSTASTRAPTRAPAPTRCVTACR